MLARSGSYSPVLDLQAAFLKFFPSSVKPDPSLWLIARDGIAMLPK